MREKKYPCPCGHFGVEEDLGDFIHCNSCGRRNIKAGNDLQTTEELWSDDNQCRTSEQNRELSILAETSNRKKVKLKSQSYYKQLINRCTDFESFYIDRATSNINIYGCRIMSSYTPYGIKQIESWFITQIQKLGTNKEKYKAQDLEDLILRNPHLHEVIKSNLILNLNSYANCY